MSLPSVAAALLAAALAFGGLRLLAARLPRLRAAAEALARVADARLPARWRRRAEARILEAGRPERLEAGPLLLATLGLSAATALGALASAAGLLPAAVPLLAAVAALSPWLWLGRRAEERKRGIARELPFVLDLLTLVVEAGNDLLTGLARVAERMPAGPLRDELRQALRELRMGRSKGEVFRDLAERTGSKELARMSAAILQADRMGAPVGESLRVLAGQILSERFLLAEKKAAEAPVKILFPLVAFIFPAVFLVLFAPIALALFAR